MDERTPVETCTRPFAAFRRRGVHVDLPRAGSLEAQYRQRLDAVVETLKRDYADVLSFNKQGALLLTPKGKTPSLATGKLDRQLQKVVERVLQAAKA